MMRLVLLCGLIAGFSVQAELWLPSLFSDNMMFQREKPAPVWGTETPGATVTVEFAGQKKETVANDRGEWQVVLDPMSASSQPQVLQVSSFQFQVSFTNVLVGEIWLISGQSNMQRNLKSFNVQDDIAAATNSLIRYFKQGDQTATEPEPDSKNGNWMVCSPKSAPWFSAVGYYMARDLQKHLGVPVGLLYAARGGAPIRCFIDRDRMLNDPVARQYVERYEETLSTYPERKKKFDVAMAAFKQQVREAKAAGKKPPQMDAGLKWGCMGPGHRFQPYGVYNGMIKPLQPFALRGFAWYQGETDANPDDAVPYRTMLPMLIENWRADWNDDSLPFLIVQIANHQHSKPENNAVGRPLLREAQLITSQTVPDTALAVTIDVGEKDDIHPKNKAPVGARLALAARKIAYGEDLVYSGPVFQTLEKSGNALLLSFTSTGSGLELRNEGGGFEVAGADGQFVPAQAVVENGRLKVWAEQVPDPRYVRYGWRGWTEFSLYNKEGLPASPFRSYDDDDEKQFKSAKDS